MTTNQASPEALAAEVQGLAEKYSQANGDITNLEVREDLLGIISFAKHGRRVGERDGSYKNLRWSDRGEMSPEERVDLAELRADVPLSRHVWLQEIIDESRARGEESPATKDVFTGLLERMAELTAMSERDLELERATVDMGFRRTCSSDSDGNPFSFIHVRADEAYEAFTPRRQLGPTTHTRSSAKGVGHTYALYMYGEDLSFGGDNANRWFISYRAEGIGIEVPFDAITEVVTDCPHGTIVEHREPPIMGRITGAFKPAS